MFKFFEHLNVSNLCSISGELFEETYNLLSYVPGIYDFLAMSNAFEFQICSKISSFFRLNLNIYLLLEIAANRNNNNTQRKVCEN